jgi:hypothetical protein
MPADPGPNPRGAPAAARLNARERALRRDRIFARLLDGQAISVIAAKENLTTRRVRQIVAQELEWRDADPADDYAALQIARLEAALRLIEQKIALGELRAVDRLFKTLEHLDKYHQAHLYLPCGCPEEDKTPTLLERLERLAASRAVVAARFATAPENAAGKENAA